MPANRTNSVGRRAPGKDRSHVRRGAGGRISFAGGGVLPWKAGPRKGPAPAREAESPLEWNELSGRSARAAAPVRAAGRAHRLLEVSTARFALLILIVSAAFTLYVGHVHGTQELLAEVQVLRRQNLRLHLKHNRLKGEFEQATGPSVIYEQARRLGLEEGYAYGPTIRPAN